MNQTFHYFPDVKNNNEGASSEALSSGGGKIRGIAEGVSSSHPGSSTVHRAHRGGGGLHPHIHHVHAAGGQGGVKPGSADPGVVHPDEATGLMGSNLLLDNDNVVAPPALGSSGGVGERGGPVTGPPTTAGGSSNGLVYDRSHVTGKNN